MDKGAEVYKCCERSDFDYGHWYHIANKKFHSFLTFTDCHTDWNRQSFKHIIPAIAPQTEDCAEDTCDLCENAAHDAFIHSQRGNCMMENGISRITVLVYPL